MFLFATSTAFPDTILQMKKNMHEICKNKTTTLDRPCPFSSKMTNWSVLFDCLFMGVMLTELSCKL